MPSRSILVVGKLRTAVSQFRYLPRAIRLVWTAAGRWTTVWLALLIFQGLLPAGTVFLTRGLVDSLVSATRGHGNWESARPAIDFAALMALALLLTEVAKTASSFIRTAQAELVQDHISGLLHEKSTEVD